MDTRNYNIDFIKGFAAISVILLHSLSTELLFNTGAPYYIWQAVPVFIMMTGYNLTNSYQRNRFVKLSDFFGSHYLFKKISRIVIPFTVVWLVEVLLQFLINGRLTFTQILHSYVLGGWGPGGYYLPIIIQAFLVLPLIYLFINKKPKISLPILFIASILLEIAVLNIPESVYRNLVIRYIFALALGSWLSLNQNKIKLKFFLPLILVSFIYITGINYLEWNFIIENNGWLSNHAPSYFWTLLLIILGLKVKLKDSHFIKFINKLGVASYHIFLCQMFYFWLIAGTLAEYLNQLIYIIVSLILCIIGGLVFYKLDTGIRKLVLNHTVN